MEAAGEEAGELFLPLGERASGDEDKAKVKKWWCKLGAGLVVVVFAVHFLIKLLLVLVLSDNFLAFLTWCGNNQELGAFLYSLIFAVGAVLLYHFHNNPLMHRLVPNLFHNPLYELCTTQVLQNVSEHLFRCYRQVFVDHLSLQ